MASSNQGNAIGPSELDLAGYTEIEINELFEDVLRDIDGVMELAAKKRKMGNSTKVSIPKAASHRKCDLTYHQQLNKIRDGDLSWLPIPKKFRQGPNKTSPKRMHCGSWTDNDNKVHDAYMYPSHSARPDDNSKESRWKMSLARYDSLSGNEKPLAFDKCNFIPALRKDERFLGLQGKYRAAHTTQELIKKEHVSFLVQAYFHVLPEERKKLSMTSPKKKLRHLQAALISQKSAQPSPEDEGAAGGMRASGQDDEGLAGGMRSSRRETEGVAGTKRSRSGAENDPSRVTARSEASETTTTVPTDFVRQVRERSMRGMEPPTVEVKKWTPEMKAAMAPKIELLQSGLRRNGLKAPAVDKDGNHLGFLI